MHIPWNNTQKKEKKKKKELSIYATTWIDLKGTVLSGKKPISKGYILYDSIHIAFSKQ